jgi:hypothetical protein
LRQLAANCTLWEISWWSPTTPGTTLRGTTGAMMKKNR